MFALNLYWTWTSGAIADVPGTACADVREINRAGVSAGAVTRAGLSVDSVNRIDIDATSRDCC